MKRCPSCSQSLPLASFHRSRRSRDGLQRVCADCQNTERTQRLARQRKSIRSSIESREGKRCVRCEVEKPWSDYYKASSSSDGHQSYCKACAEDATRRSREKHAEAQALRWAERLATPLAQDGKKVCKKCGETKSLLSFYAHRSTKDGRANYCAECQRAASRKWTAEHAEQVKARNEAARAADPQQRSRDHRQFWLKLYNLTQQDYDDLLRVQDGLCAICRKAETCIDRRTGLLLRLSVDHDHATGRVRGLLCGRCNRSLGLLEDDAERVDRAAKYLRQAANA